MPGFALDAPRYLNATEDADSLMRMILELSSEVWTLRDRMEVVEHFLDERGQVSRADIDGFIPADEVKERLESGRKQFVGRLLAAAQNAVEPSTQL